MVQVPPVQTNGRGGAQGSCIAGAHPLAKDTSQMSRSIAWMAAESSDADIWVDAGGEAAANEDAIVVQ